MNVIQYKMLELRMLVVHSNSVESKVQHVHYHCYAAINIFIKIFNVLIIFSYTGEPPSMGISKKQGKVRKAVSFILLVLSGKKKL